MYLKSINHTKKWWKATIWTDQTKYIRYVEHECDNLEWLVEEIKISMRKYRQYELEKGNDYKEIDKEISKLDL